MELAVQRRVITPHAGGVSAGVAALPTHLPQHLRNGHPRAVCLPGRLTVCFLLIQHVIRTFCQERLHKNFLAQCKGLNLLQHGQVNGGLPCARAYGIMHVNDA